MQIEIEGTIIKVLEVREGTSARTGNPWKRQDYVIETPGQYPRKCLFTVADNNIELFNLQVGKKVKVTISIDAHDYQDRWFNDFRAIGVADPAAPQAAPQPGVAPIGVAPAPAAPATDAPAPSTDDLPWQG